MSDWWTAVKEHSFLTALGLAVSGIFGFFVAQYRMVLKNKEDVLVGRSEFAHMGKTVDEIKAQQAELTKEFKGHQLAVIEKLADIAMDHLEEVGRGKGRDKEIADLRRRVDHTVQDFGPDTGRGVD